eukprot:6251953-Amphidinium_carterae.1
MPTNVRELASRLDACKPSTAFKVVKRMLAYSALELASGNREKQERLMIHLLDYLTSAVGRSDGDVSARGLHVLYALRQPLVQLAAEFPERAHQYFASRLEAINMTTAPRGAEL